MKVHHRITLGLIVASLTSCSFLFGRSSTSEIVTLRVLEGEGSNYTRADSSTPVYLAKDGSHLVAIKECGLTPKRLGPSPTRVRQLFVGFSMVHLPEYRKVQVGGHEIDRALVRAALEGQPIGAISYLVPIGAGCALDIVAWSTKESDLVKLEESFRPALEKIIGDVAA